MNTQTLEHMKQLRLYGMYRASEGSLLPQETTIYTNDELVAYLLQGEWDHRQNLKIERLTKVAHFRYSAVMEAIDYDLQDAWIKIKYNASPVAILMCRNRTYLLRAVQVQGKVI